MSARALVAAVASAILLALLEGSSGAAAQSPPAAERAQRGYAALKRDFTHPDARVAPAFLRGDGHSYPYAWPLSQVLAATLALAAAPSANGAYSADLRRLIVALADYWDARALPAGFASYPPPPTGTGGDLYYDDNAWLGLDLVEYHRATGDPVSLLAARKLFDLLISGWDDHPARPAPGGIFWVRADWNAHRNATSVAPAALIGLHLYSLTGEASYLDWAERMDGWLSQYLRAPSGLYWDHIEPNGRVDRAVRSYTQGAMIGVSLLFHQVTGDPGYLERAEAIAEAALRRWGDGRLADQEPVFNAILSRYLLALWAQTGKSAYREFVAGYADWAWERVREPVGDAYSFVPRGNASRGEQAMLGQASMVQIFALLTWEPWRLRRVLTAVETVTTAADVGAASNAPSLMVASVSGRAVADNCGATASLLPRRGWVGMPGPGGCCAVVPRPAASLCAP